LADGELVDFVIKLMGVQPFLSTAENEK